MKGWSKEMMLYLLPTFRCFTRLPDLDKINAVVNDFQSSCFLAFYSSFKTCEAIAII